MPAFHLHGAHAIMWAKQSAMMGVHQSQTNQPQSWDCWNDSVSHWEGLTRFKLNTDSGGSHSLAPNKIMNIKTNCLVLLTGQAGNRSENGKLDPGCSVILFLLSGSLPVTYTQGSHSRQHPKPSPTKPATLQWQGKAWLALQHQAVALTQ